MSVLEEEYIKSIYLNLGFSIDFQCLVFDVIKSVYKLLATSVDVVPCLVCLCTITTQKLSKPSQQYTCKFMKLTSDDL